MAKVQTSRNSAVAGTGTNGAGRIVETGGVVPAHVPPAVSERFVVNEIRSDPNGLPREAYTTRILFCETTTVAEIVALIAVLEVIWCFIGFFGHMWNRYWYVGPPNLTQSLMTYMIWAWGCLSGWILLVGVVKRQKSNVKFWCVTTLFVTIIKITLLAMFILAPYLDNPCKFIPTVVPLPKPSCVVSWSDDAFAISIFPLHSVYTLFSIVASVASLEAVAQLLQFPKSNPGTAVIRGRNTNTVSETV